MRKTKISIRIDDSRALRKFFCEGSKVHHLSSLVDLRKRIDYLRLSRIYIQQKLDTVMDGVEIANVTTRRTMRVVCNPIWKVRLKVKTIAEGIRGKKESKVII